MSTEQVKKQQAKILFDKLLNKFNNCVELYTDNIEEIKQMGSYLKGLQDIGLEMRQIKNKYFSEDNCMNDLVENARQKLKELVELESKKTF